MSDTFILENKITEVFCDKLVDYYRRIFRTGITFKTRDIKEENCIKTYYVEVYRNDNQELISSGKGVDNKQGQHAAAKNGLMKHNVLK